MCKKMKRLQLIIEVKVKVIYSPLYKDCLCLICFEKNK